MKKIFLFALILAISTQLVGQQQRTGGTGQPPGGQRPGGAPAPQSNVVNKEAETAIKNYEKAKADVEGKKATDAASWVKLGKNMIAAYENPTKNVWVGLSAVEAKILLKDQRSSGQEKKTLSGDEYNMVRYSDKELYYDANGLLNFWVVTKPLLPIDILSEAYNTYSKGFELDVKGSQKKDIVDGLTKIKNFHIAEAMAANTLGNYSLSSKNFGSAVRCSEHPAINKIDTVIVFYTGYTAFYAQEYERALHYIQRAINMGYTQEGTAYSFLAECYKALNQTDKVESTLAEGFTKYPSNQAILVTLINLFLEKDEDPAKVMEYIHKAQENEPTNQSLYLAEGNAWKKLNNFDKAFECYQKAVTIDPKYFYGFYSIGLTYYDAAYELSVKAAEEPDDKKWSVMMEEMEALLLKAIDPFEKCFLLTNEPEIQKELAQYLKNIYYRMIGKNEALYKPLYEKYRDIYEGR